MDLILWRHAEAEDDAPGGDDMQRALTQRGEKQAARIAAWLDRQIADGVKILCSPALRCEQTVLPLGRKYKVHKELAPGTTPQAILDAAGWPKAKQPVLVVGHQPVLGETAALLLGMNEGVSIRKGAVWWFRSHDDRVVLLAAQSPDTV
ncbi:MAG TPA: histidine phosphatase family protein [Ramlibacter sp.]|jgi:phosphohistidine phosphatase